MTILVVPTLMRLGGAHFDEALVGADKGFVEIHAVDDFGELAACAGSEITHFIQYKTLGHDVYGLRINRFLPTKIRKIGE